MAEENRLWGAERIRGELLKLGIRVSKRTVQRHLPKKRSNTGQNWATFLKNHGGEIWACDFTVIHDLLFRPLYVFVIIELQSRRLIHQAVTSHPTDAWAAQQLREATAWGKHPKHLIHDRDSKYGSRFLTVAASTGIHRLVTPYRAPRANAICERFIGSVTTPLERCSGLKETIPGRRDKIKVLCRQQRPIWQWCFRTRLVVWSR